MNYVSLVWFLLFCPFLFVFLLRLCDSSSDGTCPFCKNKRKQADMECQACGFVFLEKLGRTSKWLLAGGAMACVLSLVVWIESQKFI